LPEEAPSTGMNNKVNTQCVLSEYIDGALDQAVYEKLEDGSYAGAIPVCPGVLAFANTLRECERELQSVLEDWLLLGLRLGHRLPVVGGKDLNRDVTHAEVESV
jgi:predicted RNase H-like HicB family nuclease